MICRMFQNYYLQRRKQTGLISFLTVVLLFPPPQSCSTGSPTETRTHTLMPGHRTDLASNQQKVQDLLAAARAPQNAAKLGDDFLSGAGSQLSSTGFIRADIAGKGAMRIILSAQILRFKLRMYKRAWIRIMMRTTSSSQGAVSPALLLYTTISQHKSHFS